jgi:hypothetical protein
VRFEKSHQIEAVSHLWFEIETQILSLKVAGLSVFSFDVSDDFHDNKCVDFKVFGFVDNGKPTSTDFDAIGIVKLEGKGNWNWHS